jgi:putative tricarboxylic transport membrane protein
MPADPFLPRPHAGAPADSGEGVPAQMAHDPQTAKGGARTATVELAVAIIIFLFGALVAYDSHRLGSSWASDGPQAGYFPFYIGMLLCLSSVVVGVQSLRRLKRDTQVFVQREQLKLVMVILLPSTAYVLGVQYLGLYVSSALFIGLFMRIVGHYGWLRSVVVGVVVSVVAFVMFEVWFTIPLPKGPLESLLGY